MEAKVVEQTVRTDRRWVVHPTLKRRGSTRKAAVGCENLRSLSETVLLASVSQFLASGAVAGLVQFDGVPKNFGEG